MVAFAQHGAVSDLNRTYNEVREAIAVQFEQMHENIEQIAPKRIRVKQMFLFRTNTQAGLLHPVISFDLPNEQWLSPADMFGKQKLARYMRRTSYPVPGLTITWGHLNRIAADRAGHRQVEFKSEPRTKEAWYATDDPYVAAVIRELIRQSKEPGHKRYGNEMRHYYEVSKGRYILVGDHRFEDDMEGRAAAFAFSDATGIRDMRIVVEDGFGGEMDFGVETSEHTQFNSTAFDMDQVISELTNINPDPEHFERLKNLVSRETQTQGLSDIKEEELKSAAAAAVPQAPAKKASGPKKKPAILDDPIGDFTKAMADKGDVGNVAHAATFDATNDVLPDYDLSETVDADGSIDDLLSEFIEVNSVDDETRTDPKDLIDA